ncbi:MAG: hypothetical protein U9Q81_12270 [Pseudomonadota bacterium]|nr:hypothetical protein [Pseudomonadota bacterium]
MTATAAPKIATQIAAAAIAVLLHGPVLGEESQTAAETSAADVPPATQPAEAAAHRAQTALAALEERRAARLAELNKRYEELRAQATSHGLDMPAAPPWAAAPKWLSYDEMQEVMKIHGVEMPPPPYPAREIKQPPSSPPMPAGSPEEQKRIFDIVEQMTPEQQDACFAFSRWQAAAMMQPPTPPAFARPPVYGYPPAHGPHPGQPFRGMMSPRQ